MENLNEKGKPNMRYGPGKSFWIMKGIKILVLVALVGTAMGYLVMMLWNWIIPAVFSGGTITFWQALGILILAKLLFGFSRGWSGHKWSGHGHSYWKTKMEDRLKNMSPEDRESFRAQWKQRCGGWKHYDWGEEKKEEGEVKT